MDQHRRTKNPRAFCQHQGGEDGSERHQAVAAGGLYRHDDPSVRFDSDWQYVAVGGDTPFGRRSEKAGAKVELDFIGTDVELVHRAGTPDAWGVIYPDSNRPYGLAGVEIDGQPALAINGAVRIDAAGRAVIDTSRGGRTPLVRGLTPGRHRLTLTNLGQPREPGGGTVVAVIGFQVDTEIPGNEARQQAWRIADAVRGSDGWRQRAAELAATVKAEATCVRMRAIAGGIAGTGYGDGPDAGGAGGAAAVGHGHARAGMLETGRRNEGLLGTIGRIEEPHRQPTGGRRRIPV